MRTTGEKTDAMTSAIRSNKFDVLNLTERGLEVEEGERSLTWCKRSWSSLRSLSDSGAAKSVWPIRKKDVTRTKATKTVLLAAPIGSPIHAEGDTISAKMINIFFLNYQNRNNCFFSAVLCFFFF